MNLKTEQYQTRIKNKYNQQIMDVLREPFEWYEEPIAMEPEKTFLLPTARSFFLDTNSRKYTETHVKTTNQAMRKMST